MTMFGDAQSPCGLPAPRWHASSRYGRAFGDTRARQGATRTVDPLRSRQPPDTARLPWRFGEWSALCHLATAPESARSVHQARVQGEVLSWEDDAVATMSRLQSALCRSAPWRGFARRVVLPWGLQGFEPRGEVLEIGAGSGAMAAEVLATYPDVRMTVTDFDDDMVRAASGRLSEFGDRVTSRQSDATTLPFPDGTFDMVLSWVMLHHTVAWETAVAEAIRVLRPGGSLVGYDLLSTAPLRVLHRGKHEHLRLIRLSGLRTALGQLPVDQAVLTLSLAGFTVRFSVRKSHL